MNEFLKINWRLHDLTKLEPQDSFISEDVIADSLVYKMCEDRSLFYYRKEKHKIFQQSSYIPGQLRLDTAVKSMLDTWAHEQCLKALMLFQSGKDSSCYTTTEKFYVDIFQKLKPRILEENAEYQNYVLEQWKKKDQKDTALVKQRLVSFGRLIWNAKWKRIYSCPQFFKEINMINTTFNENESIIDFKCIKNVMELGTLARFCNPNLKRPCHLNNVTLPYQEEKCLHSNLPVSLDKNVMDILKTHDNVDLVISASGLKCISDVSDPKKRWIIPVVVKETTIQKEDGSTVTKNVVFVDKPFSQNDISNMDLAYISYKRLIKTNFCRVEAFSYECQDSLVSDDSQPTLTDGNCSSDRPFNRYNGIVHHNVSYRIWNINKSCCQNNLMKSNHKPVECNVLVRSKLDACERNEHGALQPVILKPKLEMQPRFGANVPSKTELAREWTSLFFTPFSILYRVRILPNDGEVVCVEKCNIQKIVAEAQAHYQYKPQLSLGILQTVFENLTHLNPGNYILQHLPKHEEAFLAVLKESELDGDKEHVFNVHSEYDNACLTEYPKNWLPIDTNFILPSFQAVNRMPGMFTPKPKPPDQRKNTKKKKSAKVSGPKQQNTKKQ